MCVFATKLDEETLEKQRKKFVYLDVTNRKHIICLKLSLALRLEEVN